ncbi:hypothetical protein EUGRSUZ_H01311 [Eucalyptus grandis]|uniref:Uncharacterized protein n=2 Tax=Eucalyptus grandis TaxID=71139 RepID=A0ACC3JQY4_EUCGR|nr:hypothetical protein EUGRSUZ_H01311 [Eucalyptus grandis]
MHQVSNRTDSGLNFGHVKIISNEIQSGHSIAHWKDIRTIFDFHEDFEHRKPQQPAHIKSFAQKVRSVKRNRISEQNNYLIPQYSTIMKHRSMNLNSTPPAVKSSLDSNRLYLASL